MDAEHDLQEVTDSNFPKLLRDKSKPFAVLFEDRYEPNIRKMINALRSALKCFERDITGCVCMIEEAPELSKHFEVPGVPTVVFGQGDSVLGRSFGLRSSDELASLIEKCLSVKTVQRKKGAGKGESSKRERTHP